MENLFAHRISEALIIRLFCRILIAFIIVVVICLVTFNVNDSVTVRTGELVAEVPQLDHKAPFESIPEKTFVHDGQQVHRGDTLMILKGEQIQKDYRNAQATQSSLQQAGKSLRELMALASLKIRNLQHEKALNAAVNKAQLNKIKNDLTALEQKEFVSRQKLDDVAYTKLKIDSTLYHEEVISRMDISNSFDTYLNYKNSLIEAGLTKVQTRNALLSNPKEFLKLQNSIDMRILELREKVEELTRDKAESDKEFVNASANLSFLAEEIKKQYIIATVDGEVFNLYNAKQSLNYLNKGEHLLSIFPKKDKFYAKVKVAQHDIRYVKVGQEVHLKLDAYYYYEQGILKGKVNYVPERKPKDDFFVLIELTDNSKFTLKSGYSVKGDIILEKLKIYQFVIKKLLRKFDE